MPGKEAKGIERVFINFPIVPDYNYRYEVSCIGPRPRPRTNTADLGPVTEPIRNHLINNII